MHSLSQPLVHTHRVCMFLSLSSEQSHNFTADELSKKFKKARFSLDVPMSLSEHRRGFMDGAFTRAFDDFLVALQTLDDLHEAVTAGPFADLVESCRLIYKDIETFSAACAQLHGLTCRLLQMEEAKARAGHVPRYAGLGWPLPFRNAEEASWARVSIPLQRGSVYLDDALLLDPVCRGWRRPSWLAALLRLRPQCMSETDLALVPIPGHTRSRTAMCDEGHELEPCGREALWREPPGSWIKPYQTSRRWWLRKCARWRRQRSRSGNQTQ